MSVIPGKLDKPLQIYIGKDYSKLFTVEDSNGNARDMTGYSFKAQIRKCKSSTTAIVTFESPTSIDISDVANGNITLILTDVETGALDEVNGVFDLQWTTDTGDTNIIIQGKAQILETVTK